MSAAAVSAAAVSAAAKSMPTVSVTAAAVGGPTTAPCTAPSEPRNLSPGTPTTVTNDGRDRWKYTVTWIVPADTGCNSISHYQVRYPLSASTWTNVSGTSVELYADGDVTIRFTVRAVNDGNLISTGSAMIIYTDELRPQISPNDVILTKSPTADCGDRLKLVWSVPDYPNGDITGYKYKCTDDTEWNAVGADIYEEYICNLPSVYSGIQCSVIAVNAAGNSGINTSNVVTADCSKPSTPESITFGTPTVVTESGRRRLRYEVTWQEPSDINCDSITTYKIRYPNSTSTVVSTTERSRVVHADGKVDISFYVSAVNNDNKESSAASAAITSAGLRPQIAPTSVTISVDNSTCVTISWEPPLWTNGLITGYQYKPDTNSATAWVSIADVRNKQICEYSPNEDVQCIIRAVNSYGYSDAATTREVTTHCDAPSKPQSVAFGQHSIVNRNGRDRLEYNVTWQEPATINCTSITTYKTRYPNSNSNAQSTTGRSRVVYADGSGTVRFYVSAVNNANKESSAASATKNTPIIRPQLYPRSIDITVDDFSCVTLNWQPPQWTNGQITAYQYKCNEEISWTERTNSADATQTQLCHFSPNQQVQCDLRARNSAGVSDSTTSSKVTTDCAAPTKPRSVSFSSPTVVNNGGRERLEYTVTWQAPATMNCDSITTYKTRYPNSTSTVVSTTQRSRVVYADGKVDISFYVSAVNNGNKESAATSADITSGGLRPQKAPTSVTITADSSICVTIRWEPPLWTNGVITGYQYKRDTNSGTGWVDIADVRNKQICGYSPYELVQCVIRARNADGDSNTATTSSIRTDCAASTQPLSITFSEPTVASDSGRDRLRYTVTWQEPSDINCGSITTYKTRYPNPTSNVISTTQRSRAVYADGKVDISFYVSAVNNDNKESAAASADITSDGLRPQKAPTSVTISVDSSTCVTISWEPPLWTNGHITGYQYKRDTNSGTEWIDIADVRNKQICGYSPYELVQCMIRARNADGDSNTATTSSIRTDCAAPVLPANLSPYVTEGLYKPTGSAFYRRRVKLHVTTRDITINCEQLNLRHYKIDGTADYTLNNQYIVDLDAITNYSIIYRVVNNKPIATLSTVYVTTGELEPGPVLVTIEPYNLSCISLTWTIPEQPNGLITHYQYKCSLTKDIDTAIYTNYTGKREVTSCGYQPADVVTCMVKASTAIGSGPSASDHSTVQCRDPGQAVFGIEETVYSIDELTRERIIVAVTWAEVASHCRYISHYNFSFHYNDELIAENKTSTDTREFYVRDLYPFTNYTVIVTSTNDAGFSTTTEYILLTQQTKPCDGPSVLLEFSTNCVTLILSSPLIPNGLITSYMYMCYYSTEGSGVEYRVNASDIKLGDYPSVCGFLPASEVVCTVSAQNIAGESPPVTGSGYTELSLSDATITSSADVATLKYSQDDSYQQILIKPVNLINIQRSESFYQVIVNNPVGLAQARNKRSYMFENEACDSNRLYNYTAALAQELTCYITAEINGSLVADEGFTINIGDETIENQYFNAPLEPNTNYSLVIGLVVYKQDGITLSYYLSPLPFTTSSTRTAPPTPPVAGCGRICIIGISVGGALLLLIASAAAIVYIRRRSTANDPTPDVDYMDLQTNRKYGGDADDNEYATTSAANIDDHIYAVSQPPELYESLSPYEDTRAAYETCSPVYEEFSARDPVGTLPVGTLPVESLSHYVENNQILISQQFQDLKSQRTESNVVLLMLKEETEETSSDADTNTGYVHYMDATKLKGFHRDDAYIAARSPNQDMVNNFWQMIWQERTKVIVTIASADEMKKDRCALYWPEALRSSIKCRQFKIVLVAVDERANYIIRTLRVSKDKEILTVKQFHFIVWQQSSSVTELNALAGFVRKVKKFNSESDSPMLVHCSDGDGKTGVFIALNILLDQAETTGSVNVIDCVRTMRERRPLLVKTEQMYGFLHQVLNEVLQSQPFVCDPRFLRTKLQKPSEVPTTEFSRIERLIKVQSEHQAEVLPRSDLSLAGSSFIGSTRKADQFIAAPLPDTKRNVAAFWQMVVAQDVNNIVVLDTQQVNYYPEIDGTSLYTGGCNIERTVTECNELMSVISLSINGKVVYLLQVDNWLDGEEKLPEYNSMFSYIEVLETYQHQSKGRVCVLDLDGKCRAGLFIAACNALDKLKSEQEVDLYSTVVGVRSRQPAFVSTMDEYMYLYNLLKYFTDST